MGDVYFFDFERPGLEKPWNENRDKLEDYFNYGRFLFNSIKVPFYKMSCLWTTPALPCFENRMRQQKKKELVGKAIFVNYCRSKTIF